MELTERLAVPSASQISGGLGAAAPPRDGLLDLCPIQAGRIVGRTFTVYFRLAAEAGDREVDYISDIGPRRRGRAANHGRLDWSVWGEQRSVGAQQRAAVATVAAVAVPHDSAEEVTAHGADQRRGAPDRRCASRRSGLHHRARRDPQRQMIPSSCPAAPPSTS